MANTQTLTPTAVTLTTGTGSPWSVTGAATAWEAVADSSDSSYINHPDSSDNPVADFTAFTDYTLPSAERVRAVRLAGRGWSDFGVTTQVKRTAYGDVTTAITLDSGYPNIATEYGAWDQTKPAGGEWLQADINALAAKVTGSNAVGGFNGSRIHRFVLELEIIKQPIVAISSPAPDGITNRVASFAWTYTGNGEAQTATQLKIFTKAVAEGGGFDPATSATVFLGDLIGSSTTFTLPANSTVLTPGSEYYVFVKSAKDFLGAAWYSSWSAGVRFKVNTAPVAAVTAPVGAVTTTSRPPVTWTYTDPDTGHTQETYEVKIWKRPGASWTGFDPLTTSEIPVWSTGEVFSSVLTATPNVNLENGATFRAYVRLREASGALTHLQSAWAFSDFNMNLTPPPAPLLSAVFDEANARITLSMTQQASAVVPETYDIERSDDLGLTWSVLRNGNDLPHTGHGNITTVYDYEPPPNKEIRYRAIATDTTAGPPIASVPSASAVTNLAITTVWLKFPLTPADNMTFPVEESWHAINRRRVRSVKEPLGRTKPIVIRGTALHESFAVTFTILGQVKFDKLMVFLMGDKTFLYQSPKRNFWVEVSGDITVNEHLWDDLHGEEDVWRIAVPLQGVDAV